MGVLDDAFEEHKQTLGPLDQVFDEHKATLKPAAKGKQTRLEQAFGNPMQRFKERVTNDVAEPFRFAAESVTQIPNAISNAYHGMTDSSKAFANTPGLGNGLAAAGKAWWDAQGQHRIESPLQPSATGQVIGNTLKPGIDLAGKVTGHPEVVNKLVAIGGDMAAISGVEPMFKAAATPFKAAARNLKTEGTPWSETRARSRAADVWDRAKQTANPAVKKAVVAAKEAADRYSQLKMRGAGSAWSKKGVPATTEEVHSAWLDAHEARLNIDAAKKKVSPKDAQYQQNAAEAERYKIDTNDPAGDPVHFTEPQRTGNFGLSQMQKSLAGEDTHFNENLQFNQAYLNDQAVKDMTGKYPTKELPVEVPDPYETSGSIMGKLRGAKGDAKTVRDQAYDKLGNPKLPVAPVVAALKKLREEFRPGDETVFPSAILNRVDRMLERNPAPSNTPPLDVKAQVAALDKDIATAQAKGGAVDVNAAQDALKAKGVVDNHWKRADANETTAQLTGRVEKAWKRFMGDQPIPTAGGDAAELIARRDKLNAKLTAPPTPHTADFNDLHSLRKDISREIDNATYGLSPNLEMARNLIKLRNAIDQTIETNLGQNELYKAARGIHGKYMDTFAKGNVGDVLQKGNRSTGLSLPMDKVSAKFFNREGVKDLINAIGKEDAAAEMMPHITEHILTNYIGKNGVMDINAAVTFVKKNSRILTDLGKRDQVLEMIRGQFGKAIEEELMPGGIPRTGAGNPTGGPALTSLQASKFIRKFKHSAEVLYGPDGVKPLEEYGKRMEILERDKFAPRNIPTRKTGYFSGFMGKLSNLMFVGVGAGWKYHAATNLIDSLMAPALGATKARVEGFLKDALMDPNKAKVLNKVMDSHNTAYNVKLLRPFFVESGKAVAAGTAAAGINGAVTPPTDPRIQ